MEAVLLQARACTGEPPGKIRLHLESTRRDVQIIRLAAAGHTNAHIAAQLGATEGTIRDRRNRIRRMLRAMLPPERMPDYRRDGGADHQRAAELGVIYRAERRKKARQGQQ